jgi:hypothetical protein
MFTKLAAGRFLSAPSLDVAPADDLFDVAGRFDAIEGVLLRLARGRPPWRLT